MRRCFPALFFYVGLRLPVIFRVPFLVSDLACLVCSVQIKVVSLMCILAAHTKASRDTGPGPALKSVQGGRGGGLRGSGEGGARKEERARKEGREKGAEGAKERGGAHPVRTEFKGV